MKPLTKVAIAISIVWPVSPAIAASPQYCAFYAREYVQQFDLGPEESATEVEIGDQAFARCLNLDEPPFLPETSAYSGSQLDATIAPGPVVTEGDADVGEAAEIIAPPELAPPELASASPQRSRSGHTPFSPEWRAWCTRHFPNSFDPDTGTVLPFLGQRRFC